MMTLSINCGKIAYRLLIDEAFGEKIVLTEKKAKSKSPLIAVIVLIFLTAAGFGGYYLYNKLVFYHIDLTHEVDLIKSTWERTSLDLKELEEIRGKVEEAEKKLAESEGLIARGSLGFFESVGAENAASILERRAGVSDSWGSTEIGAYGDATSLENMKRSFDFIRECNSLRASDKYNKGVNKKALLVNDTMMAIAQVNTNASATKIAHSKLHEVGENLAWGLPNESPFHRWYNDELKIWRNNGDGKTGHYLNIANPENEDVRIYATTGYAITDKAGTSYGIVHGQSFSNYRWYSPDSAETNYTVDEYEARFLEYYNKVYGDLEEAEKELEELAEQKEKLLTKYDKDQSAGNTDKVEEGSYQEADPENEEEDVAA